VGADGFGDFYIVPSQGNVDSKSLNARGGVTIDSARANIDFNPEVIKVRARSSPTPLEQGEIGDSVGDITGILDINFDIWTVCNLFL
jgi:hypothetical protein